jgi:transcriptional regulator with XRE-family HTH domain
MTEGRQSDATDRAIARALGEELRRAREASGWTRAQLVARLPSGIGDRTLVAYEHGARQLTVARLVELAGVLSTTAPEILKQALQKAQLELRNLVLRIDLRGLLADTDDRFRPVLQWARNRLVEEPRGIVEVPPSAVREMAALLGCSHSDLARYLAHFTPEVPLPNYSKESGQR